MLTAVLVAGLLAGYGVAIPIGAIAPLLVTLTARTSVRVGAAAALGVATVDGCYALLAVLFGQVLSPYVRSAAVPLRWVAVVVLLVIAARIVAAGLRPAATARPVPIGCAYLTFVGLTAVNPTTIVYFGAIVLGRQAVTHDAAVFVAAAFLASASWQLLLVCGGHLLGRYVDTARGRQVTAFVAAAVILALAIRLIA